jgi:superoxide reductase
MAERFQIYKCELCGNIVEVLHGRAGELVCCKQPMKLLEVKAEDTGKEKHVPVIEKTDFGVKVKIGSVPHPMEEKHYIEWVAIITDKGIYRKFLNPGEKPEAEFKIKESVTTAKEFCNVHGLWTTK